MELNLFLEYLLHHAVRFELSEDLDLSKKYTFSFIDFPSLSTEEISKKFFCMSENDRMLFENEEIFYLNALLDILKLGKNFSEEERKIFLKYSSFWLKLFYLKYDFSEDNKFLISYHFNMVVRDYQDFVKVNILNKECFKNFKINHIYNEYGCINYKIYLILKILDEYCC